MMNQQDIFKKIGVILTELNEQYQFLAQNPEKLNDLEVELFLANANFLSDHVNIVKRLNGQLKELPSPDVSSINEVETSIQLPEITSTAQEVTTVHDPSESIAEVAQAEEEEERVDVAPKEEIKEAEEIHEAIAEDLLKKDFFKPDQEDHTFEFVLGNHSEDEPFDYEDRGVDEIFDRKLSAEEQEILERKRRIHEKPEPDPSVLEEDDEIGPEPFLIPHDEETPEVVEPEKPITSEPIEALSAVNLDEAIISPPVQERPIFTPEAVPVKPVQPASTHQSPTLNELLAKTNASQEQSKPAIVDLKQSISLNEKLLFIKDLFGGYNLAYSEAIDLVNKMNNFEAADAFLQSNYAAKNNWASKQATVDQFYELLNRRFSK